MIYLKRLAGYCIGALIGACIVGLGLAVWNVIG